MATKKNVTVLADFTTLGICGGTHMIVHKALVEAARRGIRAAKVVGDKLEFDIKAPPDQEILAPKVTFDAGTDIVTIEIKSTKTKKKKE
jgi:hypothetical protein